jgi:hypothetical protein
VQAHAANAWIVSPVMPFECAKAGCPNAATHLLLVRIVSEDEAGRAGLWTHGAAPVCHEHLEEARDEALEKGKQISEVRLT